MEKKIDAKIYEQELYDELGQLVGKFALLVGGLNSENPMNVMNEVVSNYVEKELHNQFIDIRMDNPWCRVIISNIDQLKLVELTNDHKLKSKKIDIAEISKVIDMMGFKNVQITDCTKFNYDGENVTKYSTKTLKIVSDFML